MENLLNQEQLARLEKLLNRCNKIEDKESIDVYEQMDRYKCFKDATPDVRDAVFNYIMNCLGLQNKYREPQKFGYIRVSTFGQAKDGNSLEHQENEILKHGVKKENIFKDNYTGTKSERPEFSNLLKVLKSGDSLFVTKLDRFARSMEEGARIVRELTERGVNIYIGNIGMIDNTPASKATLGMFLVFAEFERNMIIERTRAGKEIAKQNPDFKEGRPPKLSEDDIDKIVELNKTMSYKEIAEFLKISKATVYRAMRKRKAEEQRKELD